MKYHRIHFLAGAAFLGWVATAGAVTLPGRPNILFIMADDHGRQAISCYGSKTIQTPNIDRLAHTGMRFTEMLATDSICSPSRAVLLTGKYNHLSGVLQLGDHFDGTQQTFPKLLQKAGYQTAIVGKWHLWSEPTGFDYYCVAPGNGGRYYDPELKEIGQPWVDGNKGGEVHKGYMTDVITDVSLNWLEHRDTNKPFCLMIHHKAPHGPHDPAPRFTNSFSDTIFPEPPTLLDDYRGRAPEPFTNLLAWSRLVNCDYPQYQFVKKQFTGDRDHDTRLMYQEYMKGYLRLVAALDENIGRVLDYLDQSGLSKNTIVVYTSDNGFFEGEHGFYNKMWMYSESLHMPLIVRLPGTQTATTNSEMVSMLDMAPTLLDLAGVTVPGDIQGKSIKPLLLGQPTHWRDSFYYHYYGIHRKKEGDWTAPHDIIGFCTKTNKLIYYPAWDNGPFWEYFDLAQDPLEMNNLFHDPSQQGQIQKARAELHQLIVQYGDQHALESLDSVTRKP